MAEVIRNRKIPKYGINSIFIIPSAILSSLTLCDYG
jgi:hypothetical protein